MTDLERHPEPTARDILEAFGASYHDLHKTMEAMRAELGEARREGLARGEQIISLRRQIDARFDQAWKEIDQIRNELAALGERVSALEARP